MKDQYFGDFGDYQKISLLEHLQKQGLKTIVHWMKTLDDHSSDGKQITYLNNPEQWRPYSPEIFDYLKSKIADEYRSLKHIEKSPFCKQIEFISEYIENVKERRRSLERVISKDRDVILFDPDNGIEVSSTTPTSLHKYVTWNEISRGLDSDKSVIIYQHFARTNRDVFIDKKVEEIRARFSYDLVSLQVKHSVYFFIVQLDHRDRIYKSISDFSKRWKGLSKVRHH